MSKRTHEHHHRKHSSSQEGFIGTELGKSMSKNEKLIMAGLVVGILIFLVVSIVVLYIRNQESKKITLPPAITGGEEKVVLTPYPTIPPIENMTVMVNSRRFSPASFTLPLGGEVGFLNVSEESVTIQANDANSKVLDLGTIAIGEAKSVVFNTRGTFTYKNKANPTQVGVIIIK